MWRRAIVGCSVIALGLASISPLCAFADDIERPPIQYSLSTPDNCVSRLQARLDSGDLELERHDQLGYLPALLKALDLPVESQALVFSKTSVQRHRIAPETPRAIYFNEHVYVGYCQFGDMIEISAVDPQLGAVFYTLDQEETPAKQTRFLRQTENCLVCHTSSRTDGVPGHLARSLLVDSEGNPILSAGSYSVDHTTPLEHRWGGWYVTGTHGAQTHLGNLIARDQATRSSVDNAKGQNVTQLTDRLAVDKYLSPHSDIVALMILEHQVLVHNRLTKANFATRQALQYEKEMRSVLAETPGKRLESVTRRIQSAGDDLIDALLLVDEAVLTEPIRGTSDYAATFCQHGPRDQQGRSLRDLDLQRRLFKFPCSFLIYSPAFDGLPVEMRVYVWQRLWDVLSTSKEAKFSHLSRDDRRAILEIVSATKTDLPQYWKAQPPEAQGAGR